MPGWQRTDKETLPPLLVSGVSLDKSKTAAGVCKGTASCVQALNSVCGLN